MSLRSARQHVLRIRHEPYLLVFLLQITVEFGQRYLPFWRSKVINNVDPGCIDKQYGRGRCGDLAHFRQTRHEVPPVCRTKVEQMSPAIFDKITAK